MGSADRRATVQDRVFVEGGIALAALVQAPSAGQGVVDERGAGHAGQVEAVVGGDAAHVQDGDTRANSAAATALDTSAYITCSGLAAKAVRIPYPNSLGNPPFALSSGNHKATKHSVVQALLFH